jgi:hypothetical protein
VLALSLFPQSLQVHARTPQTSHDIFLPHPSQFIIHLSLNHSTRQSNYWQLLTSTHTTTPPSPRSAKGHSYHQHKIRHNTGCPVPPHYVPRSLNPHPILNTEAEVSSETPAQHNTLCHLLQAQALISTDTEAVFITAQVNSHWPNHAPANTKRVIQEIYLLKFRIYFLFPPFHNHVHLITPPPKFHYVTRPAFNDAIHLSITLFITNSSYN